jgi:hypothetical protein
LALRYSLFTGATIAMPPFTGLERQFDIFNVRPIPLGLLANSK